MTALDLPPRRLLGAVPALLLLALAVAIWRVFAPAIMSFDSMNQYRQAVLGHYNDWHPPILAVALHLLLRAGGSISLAMLLQTATGLLGAHALAARWPSAWRGSAAPRPWVGLAATLLLLLPVSPLPFYLVTFWKDSCATVLFLWTTAVGARLAVDAGGEPPEGRPAPLRRAVVFALLVALLALVRHNAVVVLPVASALLAWTVAARGWRRFALALLPVLLFLGGELAIDRGFDVQHEHIDRHVMLSDLAGVCAQRPAALAEMSYLRPYLQVSIAELRRDYQAGVITSGVWATAALADPAALRREYLRAWWRFPRELGRIKLAAFAGVVGWRETHLFIYFPQIEPNEFGLAVRPEHARFRNAWATRTLAVSTDAAERYLFATHWLWMAIGLGWCAVAWVTPGRRRLGLVLLLPLAYYASYLLAAPATDYRMMYPSSAVVQCVTVAALVAALARRGAGSHSAQAAASLVGSPLSTLRR